MLPILMVIAHLSDTSPLLLAQAPVWALRVYHPWGDYVQSYHRTREECMEAAYTRGHRLLTEFRCVQELAPRYSAHA